MTTERMIMYTGGTREAIQFIEKYKKTGHVVDFYSDEYIEHRDKKNCLINLKVLKTLDQRQLASCPSLHLKLSFEMTTCHSVKMAKNCLFLSLSV